METKKETIGDLLREGTVSLMTNRNFEGQEKNIMNFMESFTKPEYLAELTLWIKKIDVTKQLLFMNMIMKAATPEGFPVDNRMLWHAMVTMVHHCLVLTNAVSEEVDNQLGEAIDKLKEGKDPFELECN